jgi:hypothetical protein
MPPSGWFQSRWTYIYREQVELTILEWKRSAVERFLQGLFSGSPVTLTASRLSISSAPSRRSGTVLLWLPRIPGASRQARSAAMELLEKMKMFVRAASRCSGSSRIPLSHPTGRDVIRAMLGCANAPMNEP